MPMKYEYGGVEYEGDDFYCYPDSNVLINRWLRGLPREQFIELTADIEAYNKNYTNMISLLEHKIVMK